MGMLLGGRGLKMGIFSPFLLHPSRFISDLSYYRHPLIFRPCQEDLFSSTYRSLSCEVVILLGLLLASVPYLVLYESARLVPPHRHGISLIIIVLFRCHDILLTS